MYAVTACETKYQDTQPQDTGTVILHLIETVEDAENSFDIFWFNDGSDTGCLIIADESRYIPMSNDLTEEDIFTPEQLDTISEQEEIIIPAQFGVRKRTVNSVFDIECWLDYSEIQQHGTVTVDRWEQWLHRLSQ